MAIKGTVCSGFGRGKEFIQNEYYNKMLKELLSFIPYHGTLNIKVSSNSMKRLRKPIKIEGKGKFGGVDVYKAKIGKIDVAVLVPEKTSHDDTLEIIAPMNLREKFKLKDGDSLEIDIKE